MSSTPKELFTPQDLATPAVALLYTSPAAGKGTYLDKPTVCNHSGSTATVTFHIVPVAGAAGGTNIRVNAKSIADKATDLLPEIAGRLLNPGETLWGAASTANVNVDCSGRELT